MTALIAHFDRATSFGGDGCLTETAADAACLLHG